MRKSLSWAALVAVLMMFLGGCVMAPPQSPIFANLGPAGQRMERFPANSDGPGRLTIINEQPVSWQVFVYSGSRDRYEILNRRDGRWLMANDFVAHFKIGPKIGGLVAYGVIQLHWPQTYTVVALPVTIGGRWVSDFYVTTVRTTGQGAYSSYRRADLVFFSDQLVLLPWADNRLRNPINDPIIVPSIGEAIIDSLFRRR